jgi:hypothetical protein
MRVSVQALDASSTGKPAAAGPGPSTPAAAEKKSSSKSSAKK